MDITTSLYTGKLIRLRQIELDKDPETLTKQPAAEYGL